VLSVFAGGAAFGERSGEGPPRVLALHGWGRSRRDFAEVLNGLDAVALDLPGFGSSPPPPEAWGSAEYAEVVSGVAEELAAGAGRPPVVLGHSFGGCVAVQLAAGRPELVQSLVLCGVPRLVRSTAPPPRPKLAYRTVRALRRVGLVGEARLEAARRRHGSADYVAAEGVMREVLLRALSEDLEPQIAALTCPVDLVWGAEDSAVPLDSARRLALALGGAPLTVVPATGHLVPVVAPAALRAALESALAAPARP
jgi:pimeloyl-ACP methyl ester carboxylesterase